MKGVVDMSAPRLLWDWGTAYDLFISLAVLHHPADFGVRGAWAAGVRARVPSEERETLEQSQLMTKVPLHWIHALPEPKNGTAVIWALGQLRPVDRLPALALAPDWPPDDVADILREVAGKATWSEGDRDALKVAYQRAFECSEDEMKVPSQEKLADTLDNWAGAEEFGERYMEALRAYQDAFFAEEEGRIRPALEQALSRAQEMARQTALPDLLEELSQGLRFEVPSKTAELVLAPSYWCTPLMYFGQVGAEREIRLFGARPANASLVPGEIVPDAMLRALKALSDPTRLRILHYLTEEPQTPAKLARRLRLRAPTVTHHLKTLRLAGLVRLNLGEHHEKQYAARAEAVAAAFSSLKHFLETGENGVAGEMEGN
jgi:DNA-binding transcriptional ArsR family regulator